MQQQFATHQTSDYFWPFGTKGPLSPSPCGQSRLKNANSDPIEQAIEVNPLKTNLIKPSTGKNCVITIGDEIKVRKIEH